MDILSLAIGKAAGGGSGNFLIASGTFTLAEDSKSVYVDVDFEPTHAIAYGDQDEVTQTAWNAYAVILFDREQEMSVSLQTRLTNGTTFGVTTQLRDPSDLTYSDGQFKFYDTVYAFKAGRTYTWYCWRENS